ncbi:hypothetical protein MKX08_005117 [Trichoderma sp. CBMAI-0020]|nr:hypothetical protein MKX08_005117 [Trichoderma sp. CBMAI-0020]
MAGFPSPLNIVDAIKISINTASALCKYVNDVKNAELEMKDLGEEVNVHLSILGKAKDLLESQSSRLQVSQELRSALNANYSALASIKCQLEKKSVGKPRFRKRILDRVQWPSQRRKIELGIENLRKSREDIWSALNIDQALSVVHGASFDSHANEHEPRCHPRTRVKILGEIGKWAQEPKGRRIYWLCGMAGTGKSTICRTVSHHLTSLNIVTASFFFKKGDNDRDKSSALFTTIVKQLVEHLPTEMASNVKKALQDNPSIGDKMLSKQFEKLVLEPLQNCTTLPPVIVVVLDALDECEDQASAAKIIELLPSIEKIASTSFKVLVASRPECHIQKSFAQLESKYHEIFLYEALHEVADKDIRSDISIFLVYQLRQIRDRYNLTHSRLATDWPPQSLVEALVDISVPLFILAATACRYIGDEGLGVPVTLAKEFLQHHRQLGTGNPLARTYLPILEQMLVRRREAVPEFRTKAEKERILRDFRLVVGTIVLLEAPLSIMSLSELLQMNPMDVKLRLSGLSSIINIPKGINDPVKLFHLSFRNFLVGTGDQDQKHDFSVDVLETHASLARQCIALLSRDGNLKQDICGLNHPGKLRLNIDQNTIDTCLLPHVRYACLYWVFHLKESRRRIRFDDETHRFLIKHLIHWLEALSLLGRIAESGDMVESLLAAVDDNDEVFGLLRDTKRFIRGYQHIMDVAPLQIYSSALLFAPKMCEFRKCFEEAIPKWIRHQPTVPRDWDLCVQTLEGHREGIRRAVLSPDSSFIASCSLHKVLIWRSQTGACIHEIGLRAETAAFSRDPKLFYLVLPDGQIMSWETDTWTCKTTSKVDSENSTTNGDTTLYRVTISHDCKLVAVAFATVIEIRSMSTPSSSIKSIEARGSNIRKLMFSPDSTSLAAMFSDPRSLEIWPIRGGKCTLIQDCSAAAYSPDSSLIALGFQNAMEIRRINEGSLSFDRRFFLGDGHEARRLSFSHDAALLASSFKDNRLGIWSASTGQCIWTVKDHTARISSLEFSHDSAFLVSSSRDGTLRVYAVSKRRFPELRKEEHEDFGPITASPDSSLIMLKPGRGNSIWQIVRADSGVCVKKFDRDRLQSEPIFTHDSALAVIDDGATEIWHPDGRRSIQNLVGLGSDPCGIHAARFSADLTLVAGILSDRSLRIWQVDTGKCTREFKSAVPDGYHPETLHFSPDAARIACASKSQEELFVWQVTSDLPAQKFQLSRNVGCFALSNTKLAAAFENSVFRIWSLETGGLLHDLHNSEPKIHRLSFSYDSNILASTKPWMSNNTIQIWNADTGARLQAINVGLEVTHLSFEPKHNMTLRTNLGRIKFKDSTALGEDAVGVSQSQLWFYDGLGYSNDDQNGDASWITFNGEKLLWLPAKYRGRSGTSRAVSESVAAIVSDYLGQFTFIGFDLEKIPR